MSASGNTPDDPAGTAGTEPRRIGGRYRLTDALGRGAMGTVWAGYDEVVHRSVAVKELRVPPGVPSGEMAAMRERMMREARTLGGLSHPNIITLYDVVDVSGDPYVVLELLPSRNLSEVISDQGRLSIGQAAAIGLAVAAGLQAAHRAGITHRDVKPGNVLVGHDGRIKLTDFGIARKRDDLTMTATGLVLGSPSYIAPEVAAGEAVTPAADLWGLGATLFASVEGRPPYDVDGDPVKTITAVVRDEVPRSTVTGPMTEVIAALMVKDPDGRVSLTEIRRSLRPLLADPDDPLFPGSPEAYTLPPDPVVQDAPAARPAGHRAPSTGVGVVAGSGGYPPAPRPRSTVGGTGPGRAVAAQPGSRAARPAAPGAAVNGTSAPDTNAPGTNAPERGAPGTNAPGTNAAGGNAPGRGAPGTNAAGGNAPGRGAPGTAAPAPAPLAADPGPLPPGWSGAPTPAPGPLDAAYPGGGYPPGGYSPGTYPDPPYPEGGYPARGYSGMASHGGGHPGSDHPTTGRSPIAPARPPVSVARPTVPPKGRRGTALPLVLAGALAVVVGTASGWAGTRALVGQSPLTTSITSPTAGSAVSAPRTHVDDAAVYGSSALGFTVGVPRDWEEYRLAGEADAVTVLFISPDGSRELRVDKIRGSRTRSAQSPDFLEGLTAARLGVTEVTVQERAGNQVRYRIDRVGVGGISSRVAYAQLTPDGTDLWVVQLTVPADQAGERSLQLFSTLAQGFRP